MENFSIKNSSRDILASAALFDVMKDAVFLMEKDQDSFLYLYLNPAALAILPTREVIGRRIEEVLPPEQSESLIQQYRIVQSTRETAEFTERTETESGEFYGETLLNPILDEDGECLYVLAIVRDVTENELKKRNLKKTQREIEIERKRLNSLVANNANAVFEFDQQKKFINCNAMVAKITGYSKKELLGRSILSRVDSSRLAETTSYLDRALEGQALDFETAIHTKNQQIAILHINTIPIIIDEQVIGIYAIARDITDQRETERLLHESEQRYKSLFENHPDGILTFDRNGKLLSMNARTEKISGYTLEELQAQPILSLLEPEEITNIRHHYYKTVHEKQPVQNQLSFRCKSGVLIDLQAMFIPIITDNQLVGIYGILTDITEMNAAQKALVEAKEELEVFWGNSTDPIFYIDPAGDIQKVNPAFEKTFGFTEKEMVNRKGTIIPPHMRYDQTNILERLMKGETVNSHDTLRINKAGETLNIISSYTPVRNADKEIIGSAILYKNVTELKKAEKELQKSQEKYKVITESTFDIITMIDLDGLIEYVSPAYETISGFSASDAIGIPVTNGVHPTDQAILQESLAALIDGKKPFPVEIRFRHQQGHYLWMEVSPTPILENGDIKQIFTISRDITERRRLQKSIARMAFYDHLTGIPNRRSFDDALEKALVQADADGQKVAVFMIDGNKFKEINDRFGHDAGDAVIREMARRLQNCVPPHATAARLGGDELAVVLPGIDSPKAAEEIAKQISASYEDPLNFNGVEIKISAGIGISMYPDHSTNEKQLIKFADTAMYEAKNMLRNTYRIYNTPE